MKLYISKATYLPDIALGVSENCCSKILCDTHQADSIHFHNLVIDLYSLGRGEKWATINFSDSTLPFSIHELTKYLIFMILLLTQNVSFIHKLPMLVKCLMFLKNCFEKQIVLKNDIKWRDSVYPIFIFLSQRIGNC